MQKVEIDNRADLKIFCPFCGLKVKSIDGLNNCGHVLYQSSDYGFEYVREGLDFTKRVDIGDVSIDEYTDALEFENSFKIAIYDPPPNRFGGYVAFQKR